MRLSKWPWEEHERTGSGTTIFERNEIAARDNYERYQVSHVVRGPHYNVDSEVEGNGVLPTSPMEFKDRQFIARSIASGLIYHGQEQEYNRGLSGSQQNLDVGFRRASF
jgi:hypothetical protein